MQHPNTGDKAREFREALGAQLRAIRAQKRLTQVELAQAAGVSPTRVHEIEHEIGDPRLSTLVRITDAAGLSVRVTVHPLEAA